MQESLIKTAVQQFGQHLHKSAVEFGKACKIYAEAVKAGGKPAQEAFSAAHPMIRDTVWNRIRLCGDGHVIPEIVIGSTDPAFSAFSHLPVDKQRELCSAEVEVVVICNKKPFTIKKNAVAMTLPEIKKAITKTGDRIPAEKQVVNYQPSIVPYTINGGKLIVSRAYDFNLGELEMIVFKMKG